jgi:HEAT repeat protein
VKSDPIKVALAALAEAARRPSESDAAALIAASLRHKSHLVAARAARAVREGGLTTLSADLIATFPRLLEDPIRRDPGCAAKLEIVRALMALDVPAPEVYLAGATHVQREPAYGGPVDTAPELRATSAMALVVMEHPASLTTCVDLLVDPEPAARAGAVRALGAAGRPDVALLLRLFVLRGDDDPGVLAEAFAGLIGLAPDTAVAFVADRLESPNLDVARAAAMALGEARGSDAVRTLRDHLAREQRADVRHAVVLALAMSRDDDAFAALLDLVACGNAADSKAAADALGLYRHDEALAGRLEAALGARRPPRGARRAR